MGDILHSSYQSGQDIKEVLEGLLRVKRIDMLIMFLERKQREGKKISHSISHVKLTNVSKLD